MHIVLNNAKDQQEKYATDVVVMCAVSLEASGTGFENFKHNGREQMTTVHF